MNLIILFLTTEEFNNKNRQSNEFSINIKILKNIDNYDC